MFSQALSKAVVSSALCLVIAGCSFSDRRTFDDLEIEKEKGNRITSGIRYLSACPSDVTTPISGIQDPTLPSAQTAAGSKRIGPLSTALIATASDFLLELVGAGLVAEQQGRNGQFMATGVYLGKEKVRSQGHTKNTEDGCIVIYRGIGGTFRDDIDATPSLPRSTLAALGLAAQPAIYLEFLVESTNDNSKRMLTLNRADYAASSARRKGSGLKSVSVVIGLGAEQSIDETQSEIKPADVAEVFRFNLGRLQIGKSYGADRSVRSIVPAAAEPGTNLVALVTEADRESVALTALTTAFNTNKSSIDDALTEKIKEALD